MYGFWGYFLREALTEDLSFTGIRTPEAFLTYNVHRYLGEVIGTSVVDAPPERLAEAVKWLHRLMPQQDELCKRLNQEEWFILTLIRRLPCPTPERDVIPAQREGLRRILDHITEVKEDW